MIKLFTLLGFIAGLVLMFVSMTAIAPNMIIYYNLPSVGIIIGGIMQRYSLKMD